MSDVFNKVFISYRRSTSKYLARLVYNELMQNGYDVFFDVKTIDNGLFDSVILSQIAARPHFVLLLSPGSLERCMNDDDWLRREIEEALRLKRNIVPIIEEGFDYEREIRYLPFEWRAEFRRINALPLVHYYFEAGMNDLRNRFLKQAKRDITIVPTPQDFESQVQQMVAEAVNITTDSTIIMPKPYIPPSSKPIMLEPQPIDVPADSEIDTSLSRPRIADVLPPPFEWCVVTGASVRIEGRAYTIPDFAISKYPVTNAQFLKFVEADGYGNKDWWQRKSNRGKEKGMSIGSFAQQHHQLKPNNMPISSISWYEAIAFCRWLSATIGEAITLPSEQQWQRAAQGNDRRNYPWGHGWNPRNCNNSVDHRSNGISTIFQFDDAGESPFGVCDMVGNVAEWCLTDYNDPTNNDPMSDVDFRVLRGGSWNKILPDYFRADKRNWDVPHTSKTEYGFRLAKLLH
jgi:hypothetical protein